jgi:hypothetical protein
MVLILFLRALISPLNFWKLGIILEFFSLFIERAQKYSRDISLNIIQEALLLRQFQVTSRGLPTRQQRVRLL